MVSTAIGFALNVGFYGMVFLLSLYLQQERGLPALATGLTFVPMTVLSTLVTSTATRLSARRRRRLTHRARTDRVATRPRAG